MKRYRVIPLIDFDMRANWLILEPPEQYTPEAIAQLRSVQDRIKLELISQYGNANSDIKIKNFIDLGIKPFSVISFHNRFLNQVRDAFIIGAYYPAVTGTCSLGERILNHLLITLREDYKHTAYYKNVYKKDSFDDWNLAIQTLSSWGILLPKVIKEFNELRDLRTASIHFRPNVDTNDRELSLIAIQCMEKIVIGQFSCDGSQPWYITDSHGAIYIKKQCESDPFIKKIIIPNSILVGPGHRLKSNLGNVEAVENCQYEDKVITDDEFIRLREEDLIRGK